MHLRLCAIILVMVILMSIEIEPHIIRKYSELIKLPTFKERFEYLRLDGQVGEATFGFDRYANQKFYRSEEWKRIRNQIIMRDNGCDLGIDGYEIYGKILIHHMNPISLKDIESASRYLLNPEYLICVTHDTHNAIHYGDDSFLAAEVPERRKNDTCPWKH